MTGKKPSIKSYERNDGSFHDSVLIFPGGGYDHVSLQKEGEDIALALNSYNLNAYVLDYRVKPYKGNDFLRDAVWAKKTLRSNIAHRGNKDGKIALMGFSAGGHLALMETERWKEVFLGDRELDDEKGNADALILCYPVVTFCDPYAHKGSRYNYLGQEFENDQMLRDDYSAEKHVGENFPPTFLWHCEGDTSVPVENSILMNAALNCAGVQHKIITYKDGSHGLGLAVGDEIIRGWFQECMRWLKSIGFHL